MKSPLQSPMSPIGVPISPYASSLPSPSGQMMNQAGMAQQKSFFGQPTSQMNGHNGHNIQSTKASQMLTVQGSQKAAQSYPNIIGILNPNQRQQNQQQQQFQQPINNFNQSQHHRLDLTSRNFLTVLRKNVCCNDLTEAEEDLDIPYNRYRFR